MVAEIIIDSNIITIGSKMISIVLGLVSMFLLFEIKTRVTEKLRLTIIYFILADICMISIRSLGIIDELGIWVSTFYDSAIVIFSILLLMAISSFYRFVVSKSNGKEYEDEKEDKKEKVSSKTSKASKPTKPKKRYFPEQAMNKYLDLTGRNPKFRS